MYGTFGGWYPYSFKGLPTCITWTIVILDFYYFCFVLLAGMAHSGYAPLWSLWRLLLAHLSLMWHMSCRRKSGTTTLTWSRGLLVYSMAMSPWSLLVYTPYLSTFQHHPGSFSFGVYMDIPYLFSFLPRYAMHSILYVGSIQKQLSHGIFLAINFYCSKIQTREQWGYFY